MRRMTTRLLFGLAISVAFLISESTAACPDGWMLFQNSCYFHHKDRLTNMAADAYCRANQSFLVDIQSQEENQFIIDQQEPGSNDIWIGYRTTVDIATRDDFTWDRTGEVGTYTNWFGPNNNRDDDYCVTMSGSSNPQYRGKWDDYSCGIHGHAFQFFCKFIPDSSGDSVVVNCTTHEMSVIVPKAVLGDVEPLDLSLNDGVCRPQDAGSYVRLSWGLSSCGNTVSYTENKTFYENTIRSVPSSAVIIRKHAFSLTVLCSLENHAFISAGGFQPIVQQTQFTESGFGTYTMGLQVTDQSYANPISSFPREVSLSDFLYFRASVDSSDANLDLFAVSCYATPSPAASSSPQYEFLREDCALDPTMFINASSPDLITFGIQAFQFVGNYTYVYVHCSLAVCQSQDAGSRCSQGCADAKRRRRRDTVSYAGASQIHTISQGPFTRKLDSSLSVAGNQMKADSGSATLDKFTALFFSFFFSVLAQI